MSRRWVIAVLCGLALVGASCKGSGSASGGTEGGTLTFGAALSLTGELNREGILTKEGYEYCKQVINEKGGVKAGDKTYKIDITYQDDQSEPDVAAQLVDKFNDDGISFILGPYGSSSTEAAAAVTERNQQLMVSSAGADDAIYAKGYQYIFGVLSPASEYLATIVKAVADIAEPKPQTVAVLSADDGFSKTAAKGGAAEAEKQGMTVVGTEYFPEGATDVSSSLTKINPEDPDLILGSVHLEEGVAIIKQSAELGIEPSGGFGETVAPPTPDFAETLGKNADYTLGSSQWTVETEGEDKFFGTAEDYATGFQQAVGHEPEYHNAEATAACLAMVLAIEDAGSTNPTEVRDAMAGLDTQSFFGPIRFDEEGKNVYKPMQVIQIQKGKVVTVWPQSEGTKPLQWPAPSFEQR
ncbi:MAG: amino acid ABC transporter substrate-binding protein [Actinomycetota bacterium]